MFHRGLRRAYTERLKRTLYRNFEQDVADHDEWQERANSWRKRPETPEERAKAVNRLLRHHLRNEGKARHRKDYVPKLGHYRDGWDDDDNYLRIARVKASASMDDALTLWEHDYLNPEPGDGPYGDPAGD